MSLIVPIRDRRRRRRILTLKNFGRVLLGVTIFFAGLTIQSDFRHQQPATEYGRLFGKQVSGQTAVEPKKADVVTVTPIEDQTAADPLLVGAAARSQYLGNVDPALSRNAPAGEPAPHDDSQVIVRSGAPIDQRHPTLSGGIFRQ